MKKLIVLLSIICVPFLSSAHGDWIEVSGNGKVGGTAKV
jgi:hypothetical protein